ncbi:MAG: quinolinate synthase NadA [Acidobacteria bacterium]|nr:quinolinate synthase NadA [Acidobacteriota bacterium]
MDYIEEIRRLKRDRGAVILAHYYQESEIQDLADFVGDSLQLARVAKGTDAEVIAFCGVHFMAETAKILNPSKRVVLPDLEAGCSLSESCPPDAFAAYKRLHPDHVVISYINTSAAIKAMSDVICTSSNAKTIVDRLPKERPILFAPDRNLGAYLVKVTGREMLLWQGTCIVHEIFSEKKLVQLKEQHPGSRVLAHPECEESILRHADYVGSTTGILKYAEKSADREFIVVTEPGIIHQMERACPGKVFIPAPPDNTCACNICPHMKKNTLEKLYLCLRDLSPEILMDEALRLQALRPIERMFELTDAGA